MIRLIIVFLTILILVPVMALAQVPVGGDEGLYVVHCNVDWAQVYFDNEYMGDIVQGKLNVSVNTSAAPYRTLTVTKEGYTIYAGWITGIPRSGETLDLYTTNFVTPADRQLIGIFVRNNNEFPIARIDAGLINETQKPQGTINFPWTFIPVSGTHCTDNTQYEIPPLTPMKLKAIIASEYPKINDKNITDWEKVNILREWAYEHSDYTGNMDDPTISLVPDSEYYLKTAPELYQIFFADSGGHVCGGMAHALQQVYEMYGLTSYIESMGDPNVSNRESHVVTLVRINYSGRSTLTVQDPYFDLTLLDKENNPADILDITRLVKEGRYSDIVIKYGLKKPKDMILHKDELAKIQSHSGWAIIQDDNTIYVNDDIVKIKIHMGLEEYNNETRILNSTTKNPYIDKVHPYLGLFKHPIYALRGQIQAYSLSNRLNNCAAGIVCSLGPIDTSEPIDKSSITNLTPLFGIEINKNSLNKTIFPNCYNGLCYNTSEKDSIFFTRSSIQDHIASKFFALPLNSTQEQKFIAKITYSVEEKTLNGLNIYIQNDTYKFISDDLNDYFFSDIEGGNYLIYNEFSIPPFEKSIRVTMISTDYEQHRLPLKIEFFRKNG